MSTAPDPGRAAQIHTELGGLAASRTRAERARRRALDRMRPLIIEGHALGMGPTALMRASGLSRRAVYDILETADPAGAAEVDPCRDPACGGDATAAERPGYRCHRHAPIRPATGPPTSGSEPF